MRSSGFSNRINSFKKQTQNSYDLQTDFLILPTPNDSTKVHSDIFSTCKKDQLHSVTKSRSCRFALISELPKPFWNLHFNCFRYRLVSSFAANVSRDVFLQACKVSGSWIALKHTIWDQRRQGTSLKTYGSCQTLKCQATFWQNIAGMKNRPWMNLDVHDIVLKTPYTYTYSRWPYKHVYLSNVLNISRSQCI